MCCSVQRHIPAAITPAALAATTIVHIVHSSFRFIALVSDSHEAHDPRRYEVRKVVRSLCFLHVCVCVGSIIQTMWRDIRVGADIAARQRGHTHVTGLSVSAERQHPVPRLTCHLTGHLKRALRDDLAPTLYPLSHVAQTICGWPCTVSVGNEGSPALLLRPTVASPAILSIPTRLPRSAISTETLGLLGRHRRSTLPRRCKLHSGGRIA